MSGGIPEGLQQFVRDFYAASDVGPSGHSAYVDLYTPETTLIMGPTEYKGHEGIRQFREAGWEKVATRKHVVGGIFLSPSKPDEELMLYGTVDYGMKDGTSKLGVEWAARMLLSKNDDGRYKVKWYQVYIVSESRTLSWNIGIGSSVA